MPRISEFLGIVIYMYWDEGSHATPHFHAERGNHEASFSVDGDLLAGSLPAREMRLVAEWAQLHRSELMQDWQLAREGKPLERIDALS